MKFYVIEDKNGTIVGCETSLKAARKERGRPTEGSICRVTIDMPSREVIRRLLGQIGGYATESEYLK